MPTSNFMYKDKGLWYMMYHRLLDYYSFTHYNTIPIKYADQNYYVFQYVQINLRVKFFP